MRGNERQMCYELAYLLKEIGDPAPEAGKTGIRGVIVGKTAVNPVEAIEKFRGTFLWLQLGLRRFCLR